ncbi:MAG: hypothetical protein R3A48_29355 [Polyangiales bacterium]
MTGTEHTSVSAQLPCGDVTVDCLLIWLCCDRCQTVSAVTGDPGEDGGAEGRLAEDLGWELDMGDGDLCPDCKTPGAGGECG